MPSQKKRRVVSVLSATARRKKSKQSLSSDWAENLAESNKGLLLRPGAMVEGVERAAKRRIRPVSFHMTIYNLVKIWEAKTLKKTNRFTTCRFCQGSVQVVENLHTLFHLDVPVAEESRAFAINRASFLAFELLVAVARQRQRFLVFSVCIRRTRVLNQPNSDNNDS